MSQQLDFTPKVRGEIMKQHKTTIDSKAEQIISLGLLKKVNDNAYICRPLPGNSTPRTLIRNVMNGSWSCDCQGFKASKNCSHKVALERQLRERNPEQLTYF